MKLSELTITQQMRQADQDSLSMAPPDALKKILTKNGWRSLGVGAEGAVAEHPQKAYVLKIFADQSAYQHFVDFVKKNQTNPHLPRFSRYTRQVPGLPYMYVRMEKLSKITQNTLLKKYMNHLLMMSTMGDAHDIDMLNPDLQDKVMDWLLEHQYDVPDLRDADLQPKIFELAGGYPPHTWTDVLDLLGTHSQDWELHVWDMHPGNFMRRGNTLVIADPYYEQY